ncbi:MAG: ABC transporter substrate-binding protein [Desulfobacterales bacterium]|nr:ABC transporter substrate-binding protein [Desulfobacterales bacterium]
MSPTSGPCWNEVRQLNPKVVFIPGYSKDTGFIMKKASEMGIKLHYLGGDGWSEEMIYQYAGDAVEGSYCCSHWNKDNPDRQSRRFVESFERSYGRIVSYTPSLTYDAFMLLANTIKRANSIDPAKIRETTGCHQRVQGRYRRDHLRCQSQPCKQAGGHTQIREKDDGLCQDNQALRMGGPIEELHKETSPIDLYSVLTFDADRHPVSKHVVIQESP